MKRLVLLSVIFLSVTTCRTPEVPDIVKGKPFEKVYIALSKHFDMVYEKTIDEGNALRYDFVVKRADHMKDIRFIRRIINKELCHSNNYVWDTEDINICIIFDDHVIYAGHGLETMILFTDKKGKIIQ